MVSIPELPDEPKYTIKMVCSYTGIRSVTLRAWERRHGLVHPHRSDNRYRLYSERDLAILNWVKRQVDGGIPISAVANELRTFRRTGSWPEPIIMPAMPSGDRTDQTPEQLGEQLYRALIGRKEAAALELLRAGIASFNLMTLTTRLLHPTLVAIGEDWYHGRINISTEHFASAMIRGSLMALMQTYPPARSGKHILIGCAPEEQHEIGSLMMAALLRELKFKVEYLGPDLPVEDLVEYSELEHADMIILSATLPGNAQPMKAVQSQLGERRRKTLFGFGGRAFINHPELIAEMDGIFLGSTLEDGVKKVQEILRPS